MVKRLKITVEEEDDILDRLADLHKQATVERSHYYVGKCVRDAIAEIQRLRSAIEAVQR
jgi:hypothetical protein